MKESLVNYYKQNWLLITLATTLAALSMGIQLKSGNLDVVCLTLAVLWPTIAYGAKRLVFAGSLLSVMMTVYTVFALLVYTEYLAPFSKGLITLPAI